MSKRYPGTIPCKVSYVHGGAYSVIMSRGTLELFMQSDWDQASFAASCGLLKAPDDWDGRPSTLPGFADCDLTDITRCSDEYPSVAQPVRK